MKRIHSITFPKARWTWSDMDTDGDEKISESEFKEGMQAIAHVLTEEPVLAGPITLAQAPILGNDLLALGKDDTDTGKGAGSVQDLQKKVEEVSAQLQMRYAEQEQRFRHQWFNLNFDLTTKSAMEAHLVVTKSMCYFRKQAWSP